MSRVKKVVKMPKFGQDILKDIEMDDEFREIVEKYAEKELTPTEMDLRVRMDRVIYILNRTLAMIKVVICIPTFVENEAEILKKYFASRDVYFMLRLLNKYGGNFDVSDYSDKNYPEYSDVLDNINLSRHPNKYPKRSTVFFSHTQLQVCQMVNLLFNNNCIRQMVKSGEMTELDGKGVEFLNALEEFKKEVKEKIYVTGEEEEVKDKELRQAYKRNVVVMTGIKDIQERLEKQRAELGEQLNKKMEIFTMYNNKIETIRNEFQDQIESIMATAEKEMMNETVISEEKQLHLAEDSKKISKQYELLLEDHLSQEKQSRSKRFKTETQLLNWLNKYDQDIGERQAEYEALKAKFDEEQAQVDELQERFEDQEEDYIFLMCEKAEEEERIFNEMAYQFLMNRSARVIQRTWRAYIARKKARRKGKKGKGKGGKSPRGKAKRKKDLESAMARTLTPKADLHRERDDDPNALLEQSKKFKSEVFDDIQDPHAFDKKEIDLDL